MNSSKNKLNNKKAGFLSQCQMQPKCPFGNSLFSYNWKLFTKSSVDKAKK